MSVSNSCETIASFYAVKQILVGGGGDDAAQGERSKRDRRKKYHTFRLPMVVVAPREPGVIGRSRF